MLFLGYNDKTPLQTPILPREQAQPKVYAVLSLCSCWSSAGCNLVALLGQVLLSVFLCPGFVGVGVKCAHFVSGHALQCQGQSAWQGDAGRSWKVESSGPEWTTTHRLVYLQKPAKTMGTLFWSAEAKCISSPVGYMSTICSVHLDSLKDVTWAP